MFFLYPSYFFSVDDPFAPDADIAAVTDTSAVTAAAPEATEATAAAIEGASSATAGSTADPDLPPDVASLETDPGAVRRREMEMDEQMSNMAAAVLSNRPSYMMEPLPPQPDVQVAFIAEQAAAAVLLTEDPETFALEPIDINTMGRLYTPLSCLTSYFPMLLKKPMLTDPIVFQLIISQNQYN